MSLLLDTHSFLWAALSPGKLSTRARLLLIEPDSEVHVSTISFWEISLKFALGKLELTGCAPDDLVGIARRMDLAISPPSAEESASFHRLPRAAHRDPFDRMLIWQCLQRGFTLVTRDRGLAAYRALGLKTVW
jgi:PIN domain nuclease of toxin-antitoxin system